MKEHLRDIREFAAAQAARPGPAALLSRLSALRRLLVRYLGPVWRRVRFLTGGRTERWLRGVEVVGLALIGAWLGLLVGGNVRTDVGPVTTQMSLRPSWHGDTTVFVSPLGSLTLDSHDGPLRLEVDVTRLKLQDARAIFTNPRSLDDLEERILDDVQAGVEKVVVRSAVAAVVGAALFNFLIFRRPRPAVVASGLSAVTLVGCGVIGSASWNPRSVFEPRYSGLLVSAPSVVGNAQDIVSSFSKYSEELAKLVTNVSKLYDVTSALPSFQPDPSTIRVLHVSDIHLSPATWDVLKPIVVQFRVDAVIDSGDLTDHGTLPEDRFVAGMRELRVPYVFVRGNHDSVGTERAVRRQPNARVLGPEPMTVAGLRMLGAGDPRFTPDRSQPADEAAVRLLGDRLAEQARRLSPPADLAVVHDPTAGRGLAGAVPLVLSGHTHRRSTEVLEGGTRLFVQGSTGGAGLRALEGPQPQPVECSVLYFNRATRQLAAWDDITMGGLGLTSVEIRRHLPGGEPPEGDPSPGPGTPTGSPPVQPGFRPGSPPARPTPSGSVAVPPVSGSPRGVTASPAPAASR